MINSLNEINRVLLAVRQLTTRPRQVSHTVLVEFLRGEVILGRNPEFEPVLEFIGRLGLISIGRKGIRLTDLGSAVLEENQSDLYELQPQQRVLLVRKCYLDGALRREMKELVKRLSCEPQTGEIMWSSVDSEPFGELEWLGDHLVQLGVLAPDKHMLFVAPGYKETVSQFLDEGGDFTEEQMEAYLREKRLVGNVAESFVVGFEKARLRESGHRLESACVERISQLRVNAGYDINSFDGASENLNHNRFIEVKGSGQGTVRFIWTRNEMKRAMELGDRYWIYFVGSIDRKNQLATREPVMLQNPHVLLKTDRRFRLQPDGNMLVEGNVCGSPLPNEKKGIRQR